MKTDKKLERQVSKAHNPVTSIKELVALAKEQKWQIDWALAMNPNTPESILDKFYESGDLFLRRRLAMNHGAPAEFLDKLSRTTSDEVHTALLNNISTPISALLNIVKKGEKWTSDRAQKIANRKLQELQKIWTEP